jgi:hypothetical protein
MTTAVLAPTLAAAQAINGIYFPWWLSASNGNAASMFHGSINGGNVNNASAGGVYYDYQSDYWYNANDGSEIQTFISNQDRTLVIQHAYVSDQGWANHTFRVEAAITDYWGGYNPYTGWGANGNQIVSSWCCYLYDGSHHYVWITWDTSCGCLNMYLDGNWQPNNTYFSNNTGGGYFQIYLQSGAWYIGADSPESPWFWGGNQSATTPKGVRTSQLQLWSSDPAYGSFWNNLFYQQGSTPPWVNPNTPGPPFYSQNLTLPDDWFAFSSDLLSGDVIIEDIVLGE